VGVCFEVEEVVKPPCVLVVAVEASEDEREGTELVALDPTVILDSAADDFRVGVVAEGGLRGARPL
jgi:hypothetical protein